MSRWWILRFNRFILVETFFLAKSHLTDTFRIDRLFHVEADWMGQLCCELIFFENSLPVLTL